MQDGGNASFLFFCRVRASPTEQLGTKGKGTGWGIRGEGAVVAAVGAEGGDRLQVLLDGSYGEARCPPPPLPGYPPPPPPKGDRLE